MVLITELLHQRKLHSCFLLDVLLLWRIFVCESFCGVFVREYFHVALVVHSFSCGLHLLLNNSQRIHDTETTWRVPFCAFPYLIISTDYFVLTDTSGPSRMLLTLQPIGR